MRITIDKDNTTIVEGAVAHRFNAATEEYMDLVEPGIIDPTKVTCTGCRMRRRSPA